MSTNKVKPQESRKYVDAKPVTTPKYFYGRQGNYDKKLHRWNFQTSDKPLLNLSMHERILAHQSFEEDLKSWWKRLIGDPLAELQWGDQILNMWLSRRKMDVKFISKLLEDITCFIGMLINAHNSDDTVRAIIILAKLRHNGPVFSEEYFNLVASKMMQMYENIMGLFPQSSESPFLPLRQLLDNFEEIRNSPIFAKTHKFLCYIVCSSCLETVGIEFSDSIFEKLHINAVERKRYGKPGIDFLHCMLDTVTYYLETGYQCFVRKSFDPLYHSGSKYSDWFDRAYDIDRESKLLTNCIPHGFTKHEFLGKLRDTLEEGEAIAKHAKSIGMLEANAIKAMLSNLKYIRDREITRKSAASSRPAPFGILIFGGSSVGKSYFTNLLFAHFAKLFSKPLGDEYIYTRYGKDKHWNGFTSQCWGIKLDDVGFLHPNITGSTGDPTLMELIAIINLVALVPPQADLADKGKTPVTAELVVVTTNTLHMNAVYQFSCPYAAQRRTPFVVDLKPKRQYATEDGMSIDPLKLPPPNTYDYPDFWEIEVLKVVPATQERERAVGKYIIIQKYDSIYLFLDWYTTITRTFRKSQAQAVQASETLKAVPVCAVCGKVQRDFEYGCKCLVEQSQNTVPGLEEYIRSDWVFFTLMSIFPKKKPPLWIRYRDYIEIFLFLYVNTTMLWGLFQLLLCYTYFFGFTSFWFLFPFLLYFGRFGVDFRVGQKNMWRRIISTAECNELVRRKVRHNIQQFGNHIDQVVLRGNRLKDIRVALVSASFVGAMAVMFYRYLKKPQLRGQSLEDAGHAPVPSEEKEAYNPWYNDEFILTPMHLSRTSKSWKGMNPTNVDEIIQNNCVHLEVICYKDKDPVRRRKTKAFCVKNHLYVANAHAFEGYDKYSLDVVMTSKVGVNSNLHNIKLSREDLFVVPDSDVVLFRLRQLPPKKDLSSLLLPNHTKGTFKGYYLSKHSNGSVSRRLIDNLRYTQYPVGAITLDGWMGTVAAGGNTDYGDCGAILLTNTAFGPAILGIHALGKDRTVFVQRLSSEMVELVGLLGGTVSAGSPNLEAIGVSKPLSNLHRKSCFRYIEEGHAHLLGSFVNFRGKMKSRVRKTLMHDLMIQKGYEVKNGAPKMTGFEPWRHGALDLTHPIVGVSDAIAQKCARAFLDDILEKLPEGEIKLIEVYDQFTAINGAAGVRFVDKMKRNTSAGFPWKKSKAHFLIPTDPVGDLLDPVDFTPEIKARAEQVYECYVNSERYCPVFCGNLKDQAIPQKKVETGATRIFCGAPVEWSLLVRQYLLAFIRVVQRNIYVFEAAPGVIAQSLQWEEMRDYLIQFGPHKMVAGDYKAYDKKMSPVFILAAFDIIEALCRKAGYSDLDCKIIRGIAEDTAYPYVDFNGDLVEFYGSNPSGHPLTVIINSLVNSLYMRYAYYTLNPTKDLYTFKDNVKLMTYGDDNIMGVSDQTPWFNHTTISQNLGELGIVYTMADKEADSIPYIHIDDCTFLKRHWRWDADIGAYVAPLLADSIEQSMLLCVESQAVPFEVQCVDIISAAGRAYFDHGRIIFESKQRELKEIVTLLELENYVLDSTFPSWDSLVESFWLASKGVVVQRLGMIPQSLDEDYGEQAVCPICEVIYYFDDGHVEFLEDISICELCYECTQCFTLHGVDICVHCMSNLHHLVGQIRRELSSSE